MKIKLKDHARQLWLSLLLMVGVAAIAVPELVETNGTIEISTVDQLKDFRDAVNRGNTYAGKTVKLTADLDLSSESNWTPIGNLVAYPSQSFNGTFDGDGHSISNVTVNDNTPNHAVAGLFGSVENGTIKNLTVKNVDLTSTHYAGGIVAYTSNGPTIENCKVIGGTIKSTPEVVDGSYDNGDKVGGIMGYATAGSTINNCTVEGVTITAYRDMGGIVGFSAGTVTNNTAINVTVTQDLTNGYKDPAPTTFGDIIGRDGGATLSNNKVIKGEPVAKIGDEKYYSLADAVAAAQQMGGAVTVELIDDISGETVTIKEVANFKLTIDGKNKTVDATIVVDGLRGNGGSTTNGASVTLQNIAFVKTTATDGIQASHYPHHLTIQDCTYSGSDSDKWFLNASVDGPLYGVTVKNVTVEHARLIYANMAEDAVFQNITATNDCKVGFNVKTSGTALIENCQVTTGKYAFRDYSDGYEGTFTLKDNTFISTSTAADEGAIVNRGGAVGTAHINVESGTYTGPVKVLNGKEGVLAISGGYFSEEFPQEYIAADLVAQGKECVPATDMEGFFTIGDPHFVAQIGETGYKSLADAAAAVPADGTETTITMIDNETIVGNAGVTIPVGKNIVLDLNGKTVTLSVTESKGSQLITNRGTLTITDSSEGQAGKLTNVADESLAVGSWPTNNYVTNVITNSGTLNIEAGNIISTANGSICYAVDNNSTSYDAILNIKGGYLTSVGTVVRQFCNSTTKQNVINMTGGIVTTNGYAAIWTQLPGSTGQKKLATLNISGGEIIASSYAWYDYSDGDSFEAVDYSISGGKFTGNIFSYAVYNGVKPGFVTGGLFSPAPSSSYIKTPGYMFAPSEEVEGYYTLAPAEVDYSWIENGEVIHDYLPFNTPFKKNYLMDGETITLLQDITLTEDLTWNTEGDATFTLNLGEFKITKGNFSIKLKPGQRVNTDKTTSISTFSADEGYAVKDAKDENGKYYYTVEEADYMYTNANGTVTYKLYKSSDLGSSTGTYKLLKDFTATARISPGITASNVTLDLNGHTLTSTATDCAILLSRAGSSSSPKIFNLIDTSDEKGGILKVNPDANIGIQVSGKYNQVTIGEGVTFDGNCVALLSENQTLTVNGTINGGNDFAVSTNGSTTKNATITINEGAVLTSNVTAMYLPGTGTTTISGGTITGSNGIYVKSGELNITGGEITGNGETAEFVHNPNGTSIVGAALVVENCSYPGGAPAVNVTGGTFTSANADAIASYSYGDGNEPISQFVHGGYFSTELDRAICEEGKKTVPSTVKEGYYELGDIVYVAKIEETKYETLQEAVNAAGTSETTITLLEEAAVDGVISGAGVVVPSGSNITFDLNGLTYNVSGETVGSSTTETQGFQLLKNSNITFKNGTLKATSPTAQMVIQNYSNLTLEDVNVDGTGLSGWAYALSNNCGTINLTGSTSITAKEGGRAFDTCKFGDYSIPTVNINTTGVISGPIEATGGKLNIENGKFDVTWVTDSHYAAGDIQITGGVFTEKPAEEYCAEGYVPTFNADPETKANYPYAVKSKDDDVYELIDAENYPFMDLPSDIAVSSVTYKRSFSSTQVGKHQAWFVPMDYTITADDAANFTFYKIQMIAGAAEAGEADHDNIYLYIEPMNEGEVLKGNRPYTVKPKNVVTDYEFTAKNTTLYAPTTKSRLNVTTSFHSYDFYGKYANDPYTGNIGDWFTLAQGSLHPNPASTTFRQYRWIIKVTANTINDDYSKIEFSIVEDGDATGIDRTRVINSDDVEGIYTTNGMKVDEPVRGINIIRYKNGKTEKIIVK